MALVHKLILGGEVWLPFALSKLQALEKLGLGYASKSFIMPDGAMVRIRIAGKHHYLNIDGGGPTYEFFTSEPVFPTTVSTAEFTGGLDSFGVTGSGARARPANKKSKSLFSSFLVPSEADPKWTLRDKSYIMATNEEPAKANFKTYKSWQTQKFFEYTVWPGNGRSSLVTSTQGMTPGRNSMANWDSPHRRSALANQFIWLHDEGEDVPPTYYDKSGAYAGMPNYDNEEVWSRHAAVQIVDGRKFFICTDNKGRFQVYPVKAYPVSGGRNYVTTYWQGVPPYPEWATVPSPTGTRLNEWVWAFNKDATKAVSCPFNSVASGLMIVKDGTNAPMDTLFGLSGNRAVLPEEAGLLEEGEAMPGRDDTPGLVEFGIVITITGEGEMDFDVEFTLLRNVYAPTDNRYIFDAAYSLPDKGEKALMDWPEDTLITAEVQMFVAPGNYAAGPLAGEQADCPPIFKFNANLPAGYVVISTNDADMIPTERLKLQAIANDGAYLTTEGFARNFGPNAPGELNGLIDLLTPDNTGAVRTYQRKGTYGISPIPKNLLGPDPCVLSALPLTDTPPSDSGTVSPSSHVFIRSLELRTMSLSYDLFDYRAGAESRILMAYNEVVSITPRGALPVGAGPDRAILNTERVPCAAVPHHNAIINWATWIKPGQGFSIHPAGHWGHSAGASESGDVVSIYPGKDGQGKPQKSIRTTHKALFNKAFGQDRDYSYYVAPSVGPLTSENYREFSAHALGYMGGFKTFGIWITF